MHTVFLDDVAQAAPLETAASLEALADQLHALAAQIRDGRMVPVSGVGLFAVVGQRRSIDIELEFLSDDGAMDAPELPETAAAGRKH